MKVLSAAVLLLPIPNTLAWTMPMPSRRPLVSSSSADNLGGSTRRTIEELTDAFLGEDLQVDDFLAALESEVGRVDVPAAKPPRTTTTAQVDAVVAVAKTGAAALIKGVTAVARESAGLVDTLPELVENIPNAKVGHLESSITYGEAFGKVGKGAQGILALATALGGFVKDAVENELEAKRVAKQATEIDYEIENENENENEQEPQELQSSQGELTRSKLEQGLQGIGARAYDAFGGLLEQAREAMTIKGETSQVEDPDSEEIR